MAVLFGDSNGSEWSHALDCVVFFSLLHRCVVSQFLQYFTALTLLYLASQFDKLLEQLHYNLKMHLLTPRPVFVSLKSLFNMFPSNLFS